MSSIYFAEDIFTSSFAYVKSKCTPKIYLNYDGGTDVFDPNVSVNTTVTNTSQARNVLWQHIEATTQPKLYQSSINISTVVLSYEDSNGVCASETITVNQATPDYANLKINVVIDYYAAPK